MTLLVWFGDTNGVTTSSPKVPSPTHGPSKYRVSKERKTSPTGNSVGWAAASSETRSGERTFVLAPVGIFRVTRKVRPLFLSPPRNFFGDPRVREEDRPIERRRFDPTPAPKSSGPLPVPSVWGFKGV